jgi:putative PIN family toxin of toxin-antitoxin system
VKVVLDTNVVVSGFLNPHNSPGALVLYATEGRFQVCFDARILSEYREVLLRPRLGIKRSQVEDFISQIEAEGVPIVSKGLLRRLPDRDDEPFLEVALAGEAKYLVTGNMKHFPKEACRGVSVVLPKAFFEILRKIDA